MRSPSQRSFREISGSYFANNTGSFQGGAIDNASSSSLQNSTLYNNTASTLGGPGGGGFYNDGSFASSALNFNTFAQNSASSFSGGNLLSGGGSVSIFGNVFSGGSAATGPDLNSSGGSINSSGYNLVSNTTGATALIFSDLQNVSAMLAVPANNGGPTLTMMPMTGSPLINAIPAATCTSVITVDQRGNARPGTGPGCSIGAYEN